jgi:PST family polysaccharide transporter
MSKDQSASTASFRAILKSTTLIGGASVLNILISMVRTKFVAILLGPAGIGLLGMYGQIITLVGTATGMGIGSSGVRQVAEAFGTNDNDRIARTVIALRRTAWLTGGYGLIIMVFLSGPISWVTFGTNDHALPIAFLGVSLLLASISAGQACVLRGTRRIADIAIITVLGALCSALISIPCFYVWGLKGIAPSLVLSAVAALITSWWYARRVPIKPLVMSWGESRNEARTLLTLGFSFMGAGLVSSASTYLIQRLLIRQFGVEEFGIYQAALALSGVLVAFVLNAMGADYYPRLTEAAGDNASVHRMVNEQSQIAILLALPGLAAMMIFSPLIIEFFYSPSFVAAVPILRWCILGVLGRVFSWPLGFVILAQGKGKLFLVTESLSYGLHLAAVYFFIRLWGINGAGIAFFTLYVFSTFLMLFVIRRLIGATWNWPTVKLVLFAAVVMALLMLNCSFNLQPYSLWGLNLVAEVSVTAVCFKLLAKRSGFIRKISSLNQKPRN